MNVTGKSNSKVGNQRNGGKWFERNTITDATTVSTATNSDNAGAFDEEITAKISAEEKA